MENDISEGSSKIPNSIKENESQLSTHLELMKSILTGQIEKIGKWYYDGCSHKEVAERLGISNYQYRVLRNLGYNGDDDDLQVFCEYIQDMRSEGLVKDALRKAKGYTYKEERVNSEGELVESYNRHISPDINAIRFLLKNAGRNKYSDHDDVELAKINAEIAKIKKETTDEESDQAPLKVQLVDASADIQCVLLDLMDKGKINPDLANLIANYHLYYEKYLSNNYDQREIDKLQDEYIDLRTDELIRKILENRERRVVENDEF